LPRTSIGGGSEPKSVKNISHYFYGKLLNLVLNKISLSNSPGYRLLCLKHIDGEPRTTCLSIGEAMPCAWLMTSNTAARNLVISIGFQAAVRPDKWMVLMDKLHRKLTCLSMSIWNAVSRRSNWHHHGEHGYVKIHHIREVPERESVEVISRSGNANYGRSNVKLIG